MKLKAVNRVLLLTVFSCLMSSIVPVWGAPIAVTKEGADSKAAITTVTKPAKTVNQRRPSRLKLKARMIKRQ